MLRISDSTLRTNVMRNLNRSLREMSKMQRQLASGQVVGKPSDNPVSATKLLNINTAVSEARLFERNVNDGIAWLDMTDASLDKVGESMHRAKTLGLSGITGTTPQDAREYIAREIDQVLRHVVALANTSFDGDRYLFGGTYNGGQPFQVVEVDGFVQSVTVPAGAGTGSHDYEILRGIYMQVNTEGKKLFEDGNIFQSLINMRDGLMGNTGIDLNDALAGLDRSLDAVLNERSTLGARMNRLDMTARRYQDEIFTLKDLRSKIGDVDMAEAIMEYNVREHVYQAALAAGARVMQPTLLDYLR
jgi:flagellar hook-associated protein 3 FlgL